MEWLKTLGTNIWGILAALAGLTLFVEFGIPLGHWFWGWVGPNALTVIALAIVAGAAGVMHNHTHSG